MLDGPAKAPHLKAMTDKIEIWTDGACSGNPGPGGWGVLLGGAADVFDGRVARARVVGNEVSRLELELFECSDETIEGL